MTLRSEWDEKLGTMRPFITTGDIYTCWSEPKGHRSEGVDHHHSRVVLRVESVIGEHRGVGETHPSFPIETSDSAVMEGIAGGYFYRVFGDHGELELSSRIERIGGHPMVASVPGFECVALTTRHAPLLRSRSPPCQR